MNSIPPQNAPGDLPPPPEPTPLSGEQELALYRTDLTALTVEVRRLIGTNSDETLSLRPAPERWSAGECIDHLVVTGGLLLPRIEEAIRSGRERGLLSPGPFRYSWPGRMFVESLQPGARLRTRTQRQYLPSRLHTGRELEERFVAMQEQLIRCVAEAAGLDLARVKVASPVNRLIRFGLGVWFASTVAHEKRHCAQAARVLSGKENV